jgi:hypothetical protein
MTGKLAEAGQRVGFHHVDGETHAEVIAEVTVAACRHLGTVGSPGCDIERADRRCRRVGSTSSQHSAARRATSSRSPTTSSGAPIR